MISNILRPEPGGPLVALGLRITVSLSKGARLHPPWTGRDVGTCSTLRALWGESPARVFELVFLAWSWSLKFFLSLPSISASSFCLLLKRGHFPPPSDGTWLVQRGAWKPRDFHSPPILSALSPAETSLLQSFPSPLPEGQLVRLARNQRVRRGADLSLPRALSSRPGS